MKNESFNSITMRYMKEDYPDLYDSIVSLNNSVYNGNSLSYKTQKLVAIALTSSTSDDRAIEKQMISGIKEFDLTKDEIMDVLKVVLLISGKPAFTKAVGILYDVLNK